MIDDELTKQLLRGTQEPLFDLRLAAYEKIRALQAQLDAERVSLGDVTITLDAVLTRLGIAIDNPERYSLMFERLDAERAARELAIAQRDELRERLDQAAVDAMQLSNDNNAALQAQFDAERAETETLRLQLAACGVAAMSNTAESAARRLERDNAYWCASYGDVCRIVDSEMAGRVALERAERTIGIMDALRHDPGAVHVELLNYLAAKRLLADTEEPR